MLKDINIEEFLILQLKKGSFSAFDKIYQMYAKCLYAYCLQFTKSPCDSEEIVQDVFVKLWTSREQIRQETTLRSLLFIMAKHHLINAFRSKINPFISTGTKRLSYWLTGQTYLKLQRSH